MGLTFLSTFQIFPNKTMKMMKNYIKMRNDLLSEIYEKHKVGDGAEGIMS